MFKENVTVGLRDRLPKIKYGAGELMYVFFSFIFCLLDPRL